MAEDQLLAEQTHESSSQFAARVRMSARLPTVVLEDVDDHFNDIVCAHSSIHLHFATEESMTLTYEELKGMGEFFVVTSHEGCNNDGEREPYR
jgi:hypothetical protein